MPGIAPIDLFTDVLQILGEMGAAEVVPTGEDQEVCRRMYNRLVGRWNTRKRFSSFIREQAFTFGVSKLNYAIGASTNSPPPDFVVAQGNAPARIEYAHIVLITSAPQPIRLQLAVINTDQWEYITIPALPATFPNTIYYVRPSQGTLNGTINPWPSFPTAVTYQLNLGWWDQLLRIDPNPSTGISDLTTPLLLPDGYDAALTWTMAEWLYPVYPKKSDIQMIRDMARQARADIQSVNVPPPKIDTTDGAMPSKASGFNWLTRLPG